MKIQTTVMVVAVMGKTKLSVPSLAGKLPAGGSVLVYTKIGKPLENTERKFLFPLRLFMFLIFICNNLCTYHGFIKR